MTLNLKLELDILLLDLHAKIQVSMSVHSALRVVTGTHNGVKSVTQETPKTSREITEYHLVKIHS